jgi:outer membrane protein assembly factor BamB
MDCRRGWLTLVLVVWCWPAAAGDWPQILGPERKGKAADDEKIASFWKKPPPLVWQKKVGSGYAGPVISQGRLILFHRIESDEVVECLDARNGSPLWKQSYFSSFVPQVGGGDGPLCTPTILGDRVITFGAQGVLSCFDLRDGTPLWSHKTHDEYQAREGYFGAGSTPIVVEGVVVVNVGGAKRESGLIGFDLETGKEKWRQTSEQGSYSAPTSVTVDGVARVIAVTRLKCVGVDPANGGIWFQFPFGSRGPTVNGATPIVLSGGQVFLTSSYGVGSTLGTLSLLGFDPLYSGEEVFASQYCTPVEQEELLYGIDGRDDVPPADLKCFNPLTRKVLWTERSFGYGTVLLADRKLLLLKTDGDLVLAEATPERYTELARTALFTTTTRALPALSGGLFYARDEATLKCVDLK